MIYETIWELPYKQYVEYKRIKDDLDSYYNRRLGLLYLFALIGLGVGVLSAKSGMLFNTFSGYIFCIASMVLFTQLFFRNERLHKQIQERYEIKYVSWWRR
jgi:hypothetical protein